MCQQYRNIGIEPLKYLSVLCDVSYKKSMCQHIGIGIEPLKYLSVLCDVSYKKSAQQTKTMRRI